MKRTKAIVDRISRRHQRIRDMQDRIMRMLADDYDDINVIVEHMLRKIAAHKAHHTMKKRKLAATDPRAKGRAERHHIKMPLRGGVILSED